MLNEMFRNSFHLRRDIVAFVEDAVNGFNDGNVGLEFLVHLVDTSA